MIQLVTFSDFKLNEHNFSLYDAFCFTYRLNILKKCIELANQNNCS